MQQMYTLHTHTVDSDIDGRWETEELPSLNVASQLPTRDKQLLETQQFFL